MTLTQEGFSGRDHLRAVSLVDPAATGNQTHIALARDIEGVAKAAPQGPTVENETLAAVRAA
jgi:hypothetical protein